MIDELFVVSNVANPECHHQSLFLGWCRRYFYKSGRLIKVGLAMCTLDILFLEHMVSLLPCLCS